MIAASTSRPMTGGVTKLGDMYYWFGRGVLTRIAWLRQLLLLPPTWRHWTFRHQVLSWPTRRLRPQVGSSNGPKSFYAAKTKTHDHVHACD